MAAWAEMSTPSTVPTTAMLPLPSTVTAGSNVLGLTSCSAFLALMVYGAVAICVRELSATVVLPSWLHGLVGWLVPACLWITVVLTVASGAMFFWRHRAVLKDAVSS